MPEEANAIGGGNIIALLFILSFAIDRVVYGLLYILSWLRPWRRLMPDPKTVQDTDARERAIRKQKLVYFVLAGVLAIVILVHGKLAGVGVFSAIGTDVPDYLEIIVTALVLIGGSDFIGKLVNVTGSSGIESASTPIEITGSIKLEDSTRSREEEK